MPRPRIFGLILLIICLLRCYESNARETHGVKTNAIDKSGEELSVPAKHKNPWRLIAKLKEQIKTKENELENAEQISNGFEHMIQLISIMGQVDTFLTDRTQLLLKELTSLADGIHKVNKKSEKKP